MDTQSEHGTIKNSKAVDLAIVCVKKEIQRHIVDANLYKFCDFEWGKKDYEYCEQLKEVISILSKMV